MPDEPTPAHAFATLDSDLHEAPGVKRAGPKRICIATPDVLGPVKNGGIGTAYHHVARILAAWGHDVVIAYVNANAADVELMAETRAFYARFRVDFEPLVPRADELHSLARVGAPTWALLEWLRARPEPFDIVHVSEWRGLGYGPLLAKSLGLAFGRTHFVVKGSSPTLWQLEGNRQLVSAEAELGWVFMERRSVELADTVICGSAHLLGWMRDAGYTMPARAFVWPNVFPAPDPEPAAVAARAARDGASLDEVVFFGRLEPRKGLVLFADAIARLVRQQRAPARVTFLGKPAGNFDGLAFIRRATRHWPVDVQTRTDCGAAEAVAYLSRPGRLAVIPSLLENASIAVTECLQAGIPFVAAATGGTPELVAPEDHDHALAPPDHLALGDRIAALAAAPLRAVRPRRDFQLALDVWRRWHARDAPFAADAERFAARARAADADRPTVTVCLVHHDRPALLRMAADSVLAQDYPALDAVLVDDGSESPDARAAVDEVETRFAPRGWRVIRQDNRYLGAARNAAVAAARGDWVLFLDDDNVLFPDAVSRLVRAAAFSGADCVPAASIRFTGDGDPREDTAAHGAPVRFLGAARAWSRVCNVVGDACALVRRDAFEAVGGFTEVYGVGLEDLELFNRFVEAGKRIEPSPDPAYYYRAHPGTSMVGMLRDPYQAEVCRARALAPYAERLPAEERAYAAYICRTSDAATGSRSGSLSSTGTGTDGRGAGCGLALARGRSRLGLHGLQASVLLESGWFEQAPAREGHPVVELRRNGRPLGRTVVAAPDAARQLDAGALWPILAGGTYSVHDTLDGETLAVLILPPWRRARRILGGVDSRPRPEIRGWVVDPSEPDRPRRVAIHVDGRLRTIVRAGRQRDDIARWQGTHGRHGFLWPVPTAVAKAGVTLIDVFDADTGRRLRGSPVRVRHGTAMADGGGDT